jgi:hypothetical protein
MPRLTAPRALAPLRQRGFRLLTIGQVTSNVGDACYAVALPWYVLSFVVSAVTLAGLLTLTSFGVFPISVALAALVVRHWGPTPFFLLAAATVTVAILAGLSQRAWRDFGASHPATEGSPPCRRRRPWRGRCNLSETAHLCSGVRPARGEPRCVSPATPTPSASCATPPAATSST